MTTLMISMFFHSLKREEFAIQSENIDNNTDEKEFVMVWNR